MLWPGFSVPKKGPDFDWCHLATRRQICSVLNVYAVIRTTSSHCRRFRCDRFLAHRQTFPDPPVSGLARFKIVRFVESDGSRLNRRRCFGLPRRPSAAFHRSFSMPRPWSGAHESHATGAPARTIERMPPRSSGSASAGASRHQHVAGGSLLVRVRRRSAKFVGTQRGE
jgi:hypothetical protein